MGKRVLSRAERRAGKKELAIALMLETEKVAMNEERFYYDPYDDYGYELYYRDYLNPPEEEDVSPWDYNDIDCYQDEALDLDFGWGDWDDDIIYYPMWGFSMWEPPAPPLDPINNVDDAFEAMERFNAEEHHWEMNRRGVNWESHHLTEDDIFASMRETWPQIEDPSLTEHHNRKRQIA